MKKLLRILLAEIIVVAVLAVALVVLILNPVGSDEESYVLASRNATEIAAVKLTNRCKVLHAVLGKALFVPIGPGHLADSFLAIFKGFFNVVDRLYPL